MKIFNKCETLIKKIIMLGIKQILHLTFVLTITGEQLELGYVKFLLRKIINVP
jgi:hypothetical protein